MNGKRRIFTFKCSKDEAFCPRSICGVFVWQTTNNGILSTKKNWVESKTHIISSLFCVCVYAILHCLFSIICLRANTGNRRFVSIAEAELVSRELRRNYGCQHGGSGYWLSQTNDVKLIDNWYFGWIKALFCCFCTIKRYWKTFFCFVIIEFHPSLYPNKQIVDNLFEYSILSYLLCGGAELIYRPRDANTISYMNSPTKYELFFLPIEHDECVYLRVDCKAVHNSLFLTAARHA